MPSGSRASRSLALGRRPSASASLHMEASISIPRSILETGATLSIEPSAPFSSSTPARELEHDRADIALLNTITSRRYFSEKYFKIAVVSYPARKL